MRNIYFTTLVFLFILWDIFSKIWVEKYLHSKITIIWNLFFLEKVYNTGIAFSFPIPQIILKTLTLTLIFWIILYYFYERKWKKFSFYDLGFALVLWWAIWNSTWRFLNWKVLDFLWVQYFSVFNLADIWITLWAIVLILFYWKRNW